MEQRNIVAFLSVLALAVGACAASDRLDAWIFVANLKGKSVTVFDGRSWNEIAAISLPGRPHGVDAEPGGKRVWTANIQGNSVSVIDVATRRVIRTIKVCSAPAQVAFSLRQDKAFVACGDGYMTIIDTRRLRPLGREAIGFGPHAIVPGPRGRLWAANRGSNDLSEIDPTTNKLIARHPAAPFAYGVAFSPDAKYGFVTSKTWGAVSVISMEDMQILGAVRTGTEPALLAVSPDGKRVYVANRADGTVSVINAFTFQVIEEIAVGKEPDGITTSSDGRFVLVANFSSRSVSVIDAGASEVVRELPAGRGPTDVELVPFVS